MTKVKEAARKVRWALVPIIIYAVVFLGVVIWGLTVIGLHVLWFVAAAVAVAFTIFIRWWDGELEKSCAKHRELTDRVKSMPLAEAEAIAEAELANPEEWDVEDDPDSPAKAQLARFGPTVERFFANRTRVWSAYGELHLDLGMLEPVQLEGIEGQVYRIGENYAGHEDIFLMEGSGEVVGLMNDDMDAKPEVLPSLFHLIVEDKVISETEF